MSSRSVDSWSGRRARCLSAGLGILALLLDGLLPTGFSLASPADTAVIGFCGGAPAPAQKRLPPGGVHCIHCLVAPVGPAPPSTPAPAAPQLAGIVVLSELHQPRVDPPASFAAAQPRGPPAAA